MKFLKTIKAINLTYMILLITLSRVCFAITQGQTINLAPDDLRDVFRTVILFSATGNQSNLPGAGVHIGEGVILTANHVAFGFNGEQRAIIALDIEKNGLGGGLIESYWDRISAPSMGVLKDEHGNYSIPDIALLIPKNLELKNKIAQLPKIDILNSVTSINSDFNYLGNGPSGSNGLPQYGSLKLTEIGEIYFTSTATAKNGFSALEPGDSGGALFVKDSSGMWLLAGIGFERKMGKKSIDSLITNLQNPEIVKWLSESYKKVTNNNLSFTTDSVKNCHSLFLN